MMVDHLILTYAYTKCIFKFRWEKLSRWSLGLEICLVGTTVCFEFCIQNEMLYTFVYLTSSYVQQTLVAWRTCVLVVHTYVTVNARSSVWCTSTFQIFIIWLFFQDILAHIPYILYIWDPVIWTVLAISLIRCHKS